MFIGEDLNEKQLTVLQAVADACMGCQFARISSVKKIVENHIEISQKELDQILIELERECLVERRDIGKVKAPHVGLTEDGERCNLIRVL